MFEETLNKIKLAAENIENGKVNNLPFSNFNKLSKHIPGIVRGLYYLITASSGIGKSQITKKLFVLEPYEFVKNNIDKNIKLKIFYFALEESKEEFMLNLISNKLFTDFGISISAIELQSFTNKLSNDIISKIEDCKEYFKDFEKYVEVIDNIYNPTGIYKYVENYALNNGTIQYKEIDNRKIAYDYKANDENEFVMVILDHVSLLQEETDPITKSMMNKHQTMSRWSADYCRKKISKLFKYTVINVQQQEAAKEKQEFYKGNSIESKLEPSLDGLADNKLLQRDAMIVLGLFAPDRYEISTHLKYNISVLKDNYRSLKILKNRFGKPNLKTGLFFDGKTNTFFELPEYNSEKMLKIYENIKNK